MRRQLLIWLLVIIYLLSSTGIANGATDGDILSDPVSNVYVPVEDGETITVNLKFEDLPFDHWAKESVTRLGALSVIKGYDEGGGRLYRPSDSVSNEEVLTLLVRLIGQEEVAVQAADALGANPDDPLTEIWARGYLQTAFNLGLIDAAQLADGLNLDQASLDPAFNWFRQDPVTREQVAMWLVQAVNADTPGTIALSYDYQEIFALGDWREIGATYTPYVEAVIKEGIMVGDGTQFKPGSNLTRAEMAQIIINMEALLYETMNLSLKAGIIGEIQTSETQSALGRETVSSIWVRNDLGLVDRIDYRSVTDSNGQTQVEDIPVLTDNALTGLASLEEGDYIQYLVDASGDNIYYMHQTGAFGEVTVTGILMPLDELAEGKITITKDAGRNVTYQMMDGLYDIEGDTVKIGDVSYPSSSMPVANTVTITLQNNVVTDIAYEGAAYLSMGVSGIVKEINETFGYITIEAWNGGEVTKYLTDDLSVEKENYYDSEDEIGYIDELFPSYEFDERDTDVSAIEPGDIVHLKLDSANPQYVTAISAKTNYSVKFGEITQLSDYGAEGATMRIAYNDGSIGFLEVGGSVPVFLRSANVGVDGLVEGQLVKILMNQAVIEPGKVLETVKEVDIDPYGNMAVNLYKGGLGIYDEAKKTLSLINSYMLSGDGWIDYKQMISLDLAEENIEIYYQGDRVSLAYMDRYLRQSNMNVYGVTEDHYGEEVLSRLILDDGRDTVMATTNVSYSNGYDTIRLVSSADTYDVNAGTIVVKDGHIVSASSILAPDYAQVVLGDDNDAVLVNITQEPTNDALTVMRGRIASIEDGVSFTVASNVLLKEMEWVYSPVERTYNLSYETLIINTDGIVPLDEFIDYSDLSKVDEVYTIIAEGTEATHLYDMPYATEGVIGKVYDQDDATVYIRDTYVYASGTKEWETLSLTNNYAEINVLTETVFIKNNKVVDASAVKEGDQIRVFITADLVEEVKINGNRAVDGYIVFIE